MHARASRRRRPGDRGRSPLIGHLHGARCGSPRAGRGKKRGQDEAGRGHDTGSQHDAAGQDGDRSAAANGERALRHVPVVDSDKVVGIVSRFDFTGIELDRLDEETGLWERI